MPSSWRKAYSVVAQHTTRDLGTHVTASQSLPSNSSLLSMKLCTNSGEPISVPKIFMPSGHALGPSLPLWERRGEGGERGHVPARFHTRVLPVRSWIQPLLATVLQSDCTRHVSWRAVKKRARHPRCAKIVSSGLSPASEVPTEVPSGSWALMDRVDLEEEILRRTPMLKSCLQFLRGRFRHSLLITLQERCRAKLVGDTWGRASLESLRSRSIDVASQAEGGRQRRWS